MTTTLGPAPTPDQEAALAHMRARYPDQLNRYTDPLLAATHALILTTHDLTKAPTTVDRTTLDHAMRLTRMALQGTQLAELLVLTTSHARGDTYQHIAQQHGYGGPKAAHNHLISHTSNRLLLGLATPVFAVWLLHRPRPAPTWFNTPTPPTGLDPTTTQATDRILDDHTALPPGTRNDITDLIHRSLHPDKEHRAAS